MIRDLFWILFCAAFFVGMYLLVFFLMTALHATEAGAIRWDVGRQAVLAHINNLLGYVGLS